MNVRIVLVVLVSTLLLAACQKSATVRDEPGRQGFVQLEGSTLVLKSALTVPAGKARVFLQSHGEPGVPASARYSAFNHFATHCSLEIDTVDHEGFVIEPDRFQVVRVQGTLVPVVMSTPVQVAALGLNLAAGGMDDAGSSAYYEGYHFWLASDKQPNVRRLTCYGAYAEPPDLQPPTFSEIRDALGAVAEIVR